MRRALLILAMLLSFSACRPIPSLALPTLPATVVVPSRAPATRTAVPSKTSPPPPSETPPPTLSPTSAPLNLPDTPSPTQAPARQPSLTPTPRFAPAYMNILRPGALSKVISPIRLVAQAHTGAGGKIRIELTGEDGSVLFRRILIESSDSGVPVNLDLEVNFEIPVVSEFARLTISIDDRYQRPISANSVDLILLSLGDNDRNTAGDGLEALIVRLPYPTQPFSGGKLTIEGYARPINANPIWAKLITSEGAVVGIEQFYVSPSRDGSHTPFTFELAYSVTQQRSARLLLYQEGERIPGVAVLSSVEVVLKP